MFIRCVEAEGGPNDNAITSTGRMGFLVSLDTGEPIRRRSRAVCFLGPVGGRYPNIGIGYSCKICCGFICYRDSHRDHAMVSVERTGLQNFGVDTCYSLKLGSRFATRISLKRGPQ